MPSYDDALALFHEWTKTESLRRHAYGVEAAMRAYAKHFEQDVEEWAITGLLHDMDYEKHPTLDEHPYVGVRALEKKGYPENIREAILGHSDVSGVPRESLLAKALYAVDELSGFVTAVAFVRPTGYDGMTPKSVKKKLKDKKFAAAVNRDDIVRGAEDLGVAMDEHISRVIGGLQQYSERLGF